MTTRPAEKQGPLSIDIRVRAVGDLFASLDPSPLVERDLAGAVEEFIVESAIDAPQSGPIRLIVHLAEETPGADPETLGASARNYFAFMAKREAQRMRRLWRDGRQALTVGVAFLVICIGLSQAALAFIGQPAGAILREGLLIIGWVANWRPVEIFLYDWRPIRRRQRIYERLSTLTVELRNTAHMTASPPAGVSIEPKKS